jgi:peroxiredoxin
MKGFHRLTSDQLGTLYAWIPVVALAGSIFMNYQLLSRDRPKARPQVKEGTIVPKMATKTPAGSATSVDWSSSEATVLYVFTPTCPWCKRNLPNLSTIAAGRGASTYQLVGLSLTGQGVAEYVAQNRIEFPVYMEPEQNFVKDLKLGSTPETIVIGPDKRVAKVWVGGYSPEVQGEVEKYLHLRLPGMTLSEGFKGGAGANSLNTVNEAWGRLPLSPAAMLLFGEKEP